jgi:hypothetical protein
MEMDTIEAIGLFIFSGLKLLFTPIGAVLLPELYPSLFEIAYVCSAGGMVGSIIFFYIGKGLDKMGTKERKIGKKIFIPKNKRIINIKNKFGLFGMSMTIGIISVPIGSILVGKYYNTQKLAIPSLLLASIIWGFAVTYTTALIYRIIIPLF